MGNHFQEEFIEEYLEALHRLDDGEGYVRNNQLARHLGISPASVTEMVQRLAERGYVEYRRYYGVKLTRTGKQRAARIHRRHKMLEIFLQDVLGMEGDGLHETACKLEHALTSDLEGLIAGLVEHITPDGFSIPHRRPANQNRICLLDSLPDDGVATVRALLFDAESRRGLERLGLATGQRVIRQGGSLNFIVYGDGDCEHGSTEGGAEHGGVEPGSSEHGSTKGGVEPGGVEEGVGKKGGGREDQVVEGDAKEGHDAWLSVDSELARRIVVDIDLSEQRAIS